MENQTHKSIEICLMCIFLCWFTDVTNCKQLIAKNLNLSVEKAKDKFQWHYYFKFSFWNIIFLAQKPKAIIIKHRQSFESRRECQQFEFACNQMKHAKLKQDFG